MTTFSGILLVALTVCVYAQTGNTTMRLEPDFNPLWVQFDKPFTATCIAESNKPMPVTLTLNAARPETWGFSVKNSTKTLGDGRVRTSFTISKDNYDIDYNAITDLSCTSSDNWIKDLYVSVVSFSVMTVSANISEGEDVRLRCDPGDTTPINMVWSRDGQVITNTTERRALEENNRVLVIQKSRNQDSGIYQCTLSFAAGFDSKSTKPKEQAFVQDIPVSAPPYMVKTVSTVVETLINDTLSLSCPVAGYPPPEVFWLRGDDSPVKKSQRVQLARLGTVDDASLTVRDVTKDDLGVYVCVANNDVGKYVTQFHVGLVGGASSPHDHAYAGLRSVLIGLCVALLLPVF